MVEITTLYRFIKIATTSCSSPNKLVYNLEQRFFVKATKFILSDYLKLRFTYSLTTSEMFATGLKVLKV